ncbi:MAG: radical SAM protein [Syntrophales bacterium]|nr:radical SAM protein [Syntrophales bacterium]
MPLIIPIFINQRGCRNRCIFCNERITGEEKETPLDRDSISRLINFYLGNAKKKDEIEIAVYGGNFSGLSREEQERILRLLEPFVKKGIISGIRISTRPDEIKEEKLEILTKYPVTTVELGAQSLDDTVLYLAGRGHTASDVLIATQRLKNRGFKVGIHLMMGLPGDSREIFMSTVEKAIEMAPHMVRIHPTVVLRDTVLAEYFYKGLYTPLNLEEAVDWAAEAVRLFRQNNIKVIRLGLQTTSNLTAPGNIVAGPFHPSFGFLVESRILRDEAATMIARQVPSGSTVTFSIPKRWESSFRGYRNENLKYLKNTFRLDNIILIASEENEIRQLHRIE